MRISDWSSDVCSSDLIDDVWDSDAMSGIPASMLRSSLEKLGLTPETRWLQEKRDKYDWSAVKETPGVFSLGHGAGDVAKEETEASIIARLTDEYRLAAEIGSAQD